MFKVVLTPLFEKWLDKLKDQNAQSRIAARILRLQNGFFGDVAPVGEGVSELRIHCGAGYRVYLVQKGSAIIIILCGGDKKSQIRDIQRAKKLAKDIDYET